MNDYLYAVTSTNDNSPSPEWVGRYSDALTAVETFQQFVDSGDAKEYARNRANEYPSIGDQLDMIYHNGDGGATFQAAIKAVKDKYPKE